MNASPAIWTPPRRIVRPPPRELVKPREKRIASPYNMGAPIASRKPGAPPYDPSTNPNLMGLYQSTGSLVLPWPPTLVTATIGSPNMAAGTAPTAGAVLNGKQTYRFGSSTSRLSCGNSVNQWGLGSSTGAVYAIGILLNLTAPTGDPSPESTLCPTVLSDSGSNAWGVLTRQTTSGGINNWIGLYQSTSAGGHPICWATLNAGTWQAVFMKWNGNAGGTMTVQTGGGGALPTNTAPMTSPTADNSNFSFGANSAGNPSAIFDLADVYIANLDTSFTRANYVSYVNARYGLSLT